MKVLIAGASRGIGGALATRLKQSGHSVFGASRSNGWDISNRTSARWLVRTAYKDMRGLDAMVNCAGLYDDPAVDVIGTNLLGCYFLTYAACEQMSGEMLGNVVLLSGAGVGGPDAGKDVPIIYAATKAAVVQMTESFARLYPDLRINAVAPGPVDTGLTDHGGDSPERAVNFIEWLLEADHRLTGRLLSAKWDTFGVLKDPGPDFGKLRRVT